MHNLPKRGEVRGGCTCTDGLSQAKLVSKTQMSIRMPVITTTMEIQSYRGILFELYVPLTQLIVTFSDLHPKVDKECFVQHLEKFKNKIRVINNKIINETRRAHDSVFRAAIEEVKKFEMVSCDKSTSLTELSSLREELSSLENQTRDNGRGGADKPR